MLNSVNVRPSSSPTPSQPPRLTVPVSSSQELLSDAEVCKINVKKKQMCHVLICVLLKRGFTVDVWELWRGSPTVAVASEGVCVVLKYSRTRLKTSLSVGGTSVAGSEFSRRGRERPGFV